ncbi:MAG: tetratricopeptide repeat protein, partial [Candidatus Hodarchaeota archaeon]
MLPRKLIEDARALRRRGKFKKALRLLENTMITLNMTQRACLIMCLNEQSQCLWRTGKYAKAEVSALKAKQLGEENPPDYDGVADALNNLGAICLERNELDQAEHFYEESYGLRENIANLEVVA